MSRVLIAGESWITHSTHIKGMETFATTSYEVGVEQLRRALEVRGHEVWHLPAHLVPAEFPDDERELSQYDVVVLSDIGANSIQLAPAVFEQARRGADRLAALRSWVGGGGGLLMIGGYLSFTGFEAKAAYRGTVLHDVLPVELLAEDDRVELPAGAQAAVDVPDHAVLSGLDDAPWPHLLGYNRVTARPGATTLATINGDPLLVVGEHGNGRSAAFTSDCSPHWAPTAFCQDWSGYGQLFGGLIEWLAG
ncbi:glutamine amidotransferase [Saccharopolyspora sp. NPDC002376]